MVAAKWRSKIDGLNVGQNVRTKIDGQKLVPKRPTKSEGVNIGLKFRTKMMVEFLV